jgi:SulP family sulfate permease
MTSTGFSLWPMRAQLTPFLHWWPLVDRKTTKDDLIAGLTGAILSLPQGVAFAILAGLPPQYGLYAAMVPPALGALFGSSRHLVSGPTNAIAIVIFASLSKYATPGSPEYIGLVLTVTLLTGLMELLLGFARLGTLINFVSHTVIIGFSAGAAVMIASTQVKSFFGVPIPADASFFEIFRQLFVHARDINPYVVGVGVFTLVSGVLLKRYIRKIPFMITATIAGSLFAAALNYAFGPEVTRITMVGELPSSLPPLSMPRLSLDSIAKAGPVALACMILGMTLAVSVSKSLAIKTDDHVDGNQEFIGQGLANVVGSFLSAFPSSGSFNRSGANLEAGAKTPLATVYSSAFLVVMVLLVAPAAAYLPLAVVAAILFLIAYGLIDVRNFTKVIRASRSESAVMLVTLFSALFLGLSTAIYAGVLLSLMLFLNQAARPAIRDVKPVPQAPFFQLDADTGLPDCPQLKMLRVNGSLFFGAVDHVEQALLEVDRETPGQKHLLVAASAVNIVDVSGAEMLAREARRRKAIGGGLYFHFMKDAVREFLERGGYLRVIGRENLFELKDDTMGSLYRRLDVETCRRCTVRIFKPCNVMLPNGEPRSDPLPKAEGLAQPTAAAAADASLPIGSPIEQAAK